MKQEEINELMTNASAALGKILEGLEEPSYKGYSINWKCKVDRIRALLAHAKILTDRALNGEPPDIYMAEHNRLPDEYGEWEAVHEGEYSDWTVSKPCGGLDIADINISSGLTYYDKKHLAGIFNMVEDILLGAADELELVNALKYHIEDFYPEEFATKEEAEAFAEKLNQAAEQEAGK